MIALCGSFFSTDASHFRAKNDASIVSYMGKWLFVTMVAYDHVVHLSLSLFELTLLVSPGSFQIQSWLVFTANPVCLLENRCSMRVRYPREALRGGIPVSFLKPLCRSWSHFVGIYRQKLTRSQKNWLGDTPTKGLAWCTYCRGSASGAVLSPIDAHRSKVYGWLLFETAVDLCSVRVTFAVARFEASSGRQTWWLCWLWSVISTMCKAWAVLALVLWQWNTNLSG